MVMVIIYQFNLSYFPHLKIHVPIHTDFQNPMLIHYLRKYCKLKDICIEIVSNVKTGIVMSIC